jgi:hypothetical protein
MTIEPQKDCWFGDASKKMTLGELLGYQTSSGSGIGYLDDIILYGATAPDSTSVPTNMLSLEENNLWVKSDGSTANTSLELSNFFVFRTSASTNARTWNIPASVKFYGCFSRNDRPNTW